MTYVKPLAFILWALSFEQISFAVDGSQASLHPLSQSSQISLTPAFTPDGKTAYFPLSPCADIGACPQIMHVSHMQNGTWSKPKSLNLSLRGYNGKTARVDWPSVTPDGKTLLFSWSREREEKIEQGALEDFDLWSLDLTNPQAKPKPLQGKQLNLTRGGELGKIEYFYNETSPRLTEAGMLYFWTQREGGAGDRDIYQAQRLDGGRFSAPQILPAPINSAANDTVGWVSADGTKMLFNRGADIYKSHQSGGVWSEPEALGPEVNTAYSDFGATLTPDGKTIVFSSTRPSEGNVAGLIQIWQAPYNK